jgi:acetyl esterase
MLASERLLLKDERIDPRVKIFLRELIHLLEPIEKKMIEENIQSLQDITLQPNLTRLQMIDYVKKELIKYGTFFQQEFKKLPKKKVEEVFGSMEKGEAIRLHTGYNFFSREYDYLYSNKGLDIDNSRTFVSYPDNNVVKVSIIKPISLKAPYPTIVYYHGGGMTQSSAFGNQYQRWFKTLARQNVCVIGVDFRNAGFPDPANISNPVAPFPAGLNDCYSGLKWVYDNAAELNVDRKRILIAGESGGGNLSIATALKAKEENSLFMLSSGIYCMCPYIAGTWSGRETWSDRLGISHKENHGLLLKIPIHDDAQYIFGQKMYCGEIKTNWLNPKAWPGYATVNDVKGLPRIKISVNECDPLRDEGILFYRKCMKANVKAYCRIVLGTCHGGDSIVYDKCVPDICLQTARDISQFAIFNDEYPYKKEVVSGTAKL